MLSHTHGQGTVRSSRSLSLTAAEVKERRRGQPVDLQNRSSTCSNREHGRGSAKAKQPCCLWRRCGGVTVFI